MRQAEILSPEAREALIEGGCLGRREWREYELKAAVRDRLNAMRETPLQSIEDFIQACRVIFATAPKPMSLDHRQITLLHVAREWDQLTPSAEFEPLYAFIIYSYRSRLAEESWSLGHLAPLDVYGFETEEFEAELLGSLWEAGC